MSRSSYLRYILHCITSIWLYSQVHVIELTYLEKYGLGDTFSVLRQKCSKIRIDQNLELNCPLARLLETGRTQFEPESQAKWFLD